MSDTNVVQVSPSTLSGSTASCYSSGTGLTMFMMRADVRRLLPREFDAAGKPTGRRLVNDAELQTNIDPETDLPYPLHTVSLPERGTGNNVPQSAGVSLVVIYRDPAEPLRKILVYDGIAVLPDIGGATLSQTIRGIYQSSASSRRSSHTSSAAARETGPSACSSRAPGARRALPPMRSRGPRLVPTDRGARERSTRTT